MWITGSEIIGLYRRLTSQQWLVIAEHIAEKQCYYTDDDDDDDDDDGDGGGRVGGNKITMSGY